MFILRGLMKETIEEQGWVEGHPLVTRNIVVLAKSDSREIQDSLGHFTCILHV